MPVVDVQQHLEQHTITIAAVFAAPVERVWALYADPGLLERVWGPPEWPATFLRHELTPGSRTHYVMTGPDGQWAHGAWDVVAVDAPRSFTVRDAFADERGEPQEELGWTRMSARLDEVAEGTRVVFVSEFESAEQLQQMLDMGMDEGMREAMAQIDGVLLEPAA